MVVEECDDEEGVFSFNGAADGQPLQNHERYLDGSYIGRVLNPEPQDVVPTKNTVRRKATKYKTKPKKKAKSEKRTLKEYLRTYDVL